METLSSMKMSPIFLLTKTESSTKPSPLGNIQSACPVTRSGSALATAAASLLAIEIQGMNTADANILAQRIIIYLMDSTDDSLPGDLCVYESIRRFPERFDCASLPWRALLIALEE